MDNNSIYYKQVQLLVQVLPFVALQDCFALKGGTAINLFIHNLPRLSVDIDLVYLPMKNRQDALQAIKLALSAIKASIEKTLVDATVYETYKDKSDALRLIVSRGGVQIKIELSPVLRGTVFPPVKMVVCEAVEEEFGFAEIAVVASADLYAGKVCAALDRQHPRDLFDIKMLLDAEGFTHDLRKAFLVYLASHNRPISELLCPKLKDIESLYAGEFLDMAEVNVPFSELLKTRDQLIELIHQELDEDDRQFLLSFKNLQPDWSLLSLEGVSELPAIQWKLMNLAKMTVKKREEAYRSLAKLLAC